MEKENTNTVSPTDPGEFESVAVRISLLSVVGNLLLSLFKLLAGVLAHSGAMISDAVHSASDVISSFIVIIGVKIAARDADRDHPYGHERFECVAAIVLSVVLLVTGLFIGYKASGKITGASTEPAVIPGVLALVAAVVSIVCKEAMFWYTRHYARRIHSEALMAEAWHHRSDALSSVGALLGILGARMGYPVLDPVASLVICVFIAKAAYDIFRDAIDKMVDRSCSEETEQALRRCAENQDGVLAVDLLQTRVFGNRIYVDIEIAADGELSLRAAHEIAEQVHNAIEQGFPDVKHIMVHVNPYEAPAEK
ncbi:MAG: cation transporter [Oscillospiraceae bacterium]|nr:cation transporter [Oscillospiraceae bacterium]